MCSRRRWPPSRAPQLLVMQLECKERGFEPEEVAPEEVAPEEMAPVAVAPEKLSSVEPASGEPVLGQPPGEPVPCHPAPGVPAARESSAEAEAQTDGVTSTGRREVDHVGAFAEASEIPAAASDQARAAPRA